MYVLLWKLLTIFLHVVFVLLHSVSYCFTEVSFDSYDLCVYTVEMFASCVLIFIVAALYEGLKVARDSLLRKASSGPCNGDAVAVPTTDIPMVETVNKMPSRCVG